jgi:ribosomal protein S5
MSEPASGLTGVKDVLTRWMQATTPGNTVVQTTVAGQREQRPPSGACTPRGLKRHRRT